MPDSTRSASRRAAPSWRGGPIWRTTAAELRPGRALWREGHGHRLPPVDKIRTQPAHRARELHVRDAAQDLLEHHAHLQAREVGAEAEVLPEPEGQVVVRGPRDVETVGVLEDGLVAVGRRVPDDD